MLKSTLTDTDKLLVEAISTMLQHDAKLGLRDELNRQDLNATERGFEYLHGNIDEMFALKAAESNFFESLCQAFNKVHCYKYLDDPTFTIAMEKELTAQGIPATERAKAANNIKQIIEELKAEKSDWAERDYGFNKDMAEIRRVSQPQQYK